MYEGKIQEL
jgi:predicted transcriptional regulator